MARTVKRPAVVLPPVDEEAPRPYERGEGWWRHKERGPAMTLELDAGAFDYIWLWLQYKLKEAQQPTRAEAFPEQLDTVTRAYNAFAASVRRLNAEVAEIDARTKAPARRVVRRVPTPAKKATKKRG